MLGFVLAHPFKLTLTGLLATWAAEGGNHAFNATVVAAFVWMFDA